VPSVRRQCCIVHDGGDRTLRAHCKKSAKHLPLPSGNDAYESLHHHATNPSPDPDRCSQMHRCLAVPVPTFRLRDSLSECYITGRCLPAMTPRVHVMGDEVRTERELLPMDNHNQQLYRSQSICPITGQHSLFLSSAIRIAIDPPYGFTTP